MVSSEIDLPSEDVSYVNIMDALDTFIELLNRYAMLMKSNGHITSFLNTIQSNFMTL